jgi:hypothetical protein
MARTLRAVSRNGKPGGHRLKCRSTSDDAPLMNKPKELPLPPRKAGHPEDKAKAKKAQVDMIGFILAKVAEMTAQQIKRGALDLESLDSYIKTVEFGLNGLRNAREVLGRPDK